MAWHHRFRMNWDAWWFKLDKKKSTDFLIHKVDFTVDDFSELSFVDSSEDLRGDVDTVVLVLFEHVYEENLTVLSYKHVIDFGLDLWLWYFLLVLGELFLFL